MILPSYYPYSTTYLRDRMRRISRLAMVTAIYGTSVFITACIILWVLSLFVNLS